MVLPAFDHRTGHFEDVLIHYNSVWLTLKEPLIAVSHRKKTEISQVSLSFRL